MPEIEDAIVELQVQRSEFPGDSDFQKPDDYVFCNEDGTPVYNNAWGDLWKDMLNALYETRGIDLRTDREPCTVVSRYRKPRHLRNFAIGHGIAAAVGRRREPMPSPMRLMD
jgi:hypothetical protein